MDVEEFKQKYEELKDNPMYKNFCSILDTKNQVLERTAKKNQELKKQLSNSHQIKAQQREFINWLEDGIRTLEMLDETFILQNYKNEIRIYEEILSKYKEITGVKDGEN